MKLPKPSRSKFRMGSHASGVVAGLTAIVKVFIVLAPSSSVTVNEAVYEPVVANVWETDNFAVVGKPGLPCRKLLMGTRCEGVPSPQRMLAVKVSTVPRTDGKPGSETEIEGRVKS